MIHRFRRTSRLFAVLAVPAALLLATVTWAFTTQAQPLDDAAVAPQPQRFATIDLIIDTGDAPLAAWQIDLRDARGSAAIVGIEGGEHPAFAEPPYYDPRAMMRNRIVLAAYNTADAAALPQGRTRIATLHLQITGNAEPDWQLELITAVDDQGQPITAELTHE